MGKTTNTDIARKAGLSTATVDRALNGRPGVTPANRQRVLQAARELGYLPSEGMVPLPARPAHLEFLIPFGQNAFMRDIARSIADFAATQPLVASCNVAMLDGIGPDALVPALDALAARTNGVGVITIDHPKTRHAIRQRTRLSHEQLGPLAADLLQVVDQLVGRRPGPMRRVVENDDRRR